MIDTIIQKYYTIHINDLVFRLFNAASSQALDYSYQVKGSKSRFRL